MKKGWTAPEKMDSDDPTGGFDASDPAALEAVMGVNKQFNLGRHNPALISMMSSSLAPTDETTGQQFLTGIMRMKQIYIRQTDELLKWSYG